MKEKNSGNIIFLTIAKELLDTMYGNEKNPSRVFDIYKRLFGL